MDTIETGIGPASSAKLSLEISDLVSRSLRGESIDMPAEGVRLAGCYPDLGMTGEMIASAIARALGMVGAIRNGADAGDERAATGASAAAAEAGPPDSLPAALPPDLAGVIGQSQEPILVQERGHEPGAAASLASENAPDPVRASRRSAPLAARFSLRSVAAVRRAFFRN